MSFFHLLHLFELIVPTLLPSMSGFEDDFGEMVEPVAIVPTLVGEVNNTSSSGNLTSGGVVSRRRRS